MPERTTIVLPLDLKEKAVACARREGVSFGELVRQSLEQRVAPSSKKVKLKLKRKVKADPFWDNLATYTIDGDADLSVNHDEYIYGSKR